MGNHYCFVLRTRQANLSRLRRHTNGVFTQSFNRRHGKVGRLFQGRFKSIVVDRESYLMEALRYVELNPVRANIVKQPQNWPGSSYRAHTGVAARPDWLNASGIHAHLLWRAPESAANGRRAAGNRRRARAARCRRRAGRNRPSPSICSDCCAAARRSTRRRTTPTAPAAPQSPRGLCNAACLFHGSAA
jgi:hypothetical protein